MSEATWPDIVWNAEAEIILLDKYGVLFDANGFPISIPEKLPLMESIFTLETLIEYRYMQPSKTVRRPDKRYPPCLYRWLQQIEKC